MQFAAFECGRQAAFFVSEKRVSCYCTRVGIFKTVTVFFPLDPGAGFFFIAKCENNWYDYNIGIKRAKSLLSSDIMRIDEDDLQWFSAGPVASGWKLLR